MCIGTRLSVSLAASDERCVITGKLLHCLRAADSVTYVEYAPSSAPSAASHLARSDAPLLGWVRKVFYWGPQVG